MKYTDAGSVVQYGVQTPSSTTVLLVTDRLDEAEHILDVVGEGRIVRRTGEYAESLAHYERAIALFQRRNTDHRNLARRQTLKGDQLRSIPSVVLH